MVDGVVGGAGAAALRAAALVAPTPGHLENVSAATLHTLPAVLGGAYLPPLLDARERVRALAEDLLGGGEPLFVEFTSLLTWREGSGIGLHRDDDAEHLRARHVSAVLYLSDGGAGGDFGGGTLVVEPEAGSPVAVVPRVGRLAVYPSSTPHRVEPVEWGARTALAVWLTFDGAHSEDARLLAPGMPLAALAEGRAPPPLPESMFEAGGGEDARHAALRRIGVDAARLSESWCESPEHALAVSAFCEAHGAELAALAPGEAARAAADWEEHAAGERERVLRAARSWRRVGALLAPDG